VADFGLPLLLVSPRPPRSSLAQMISEPGSSQVHLSSAHDVKSRPQAFTGDHASQATTSRPLGVLTPWVPGERAHAPAFCSSFCT
jgi:hypothetical protein